MYKAEICSIPQLVHFLVLSVQISRGFLGRGTRVFRIDPSQWLPWFLWSKSRSLSHIAWSKQSTFALFPTCQSSSETHEGADIVGNREWGGLGCLRLRVLVKWCPGSTRDEDRGKFLAPSQPTSFDVHPTKPYIILRPFFVLTNRALWAINLSGNYSIPQRFPLGYILDTKYHAYIIIGKTLNVHIWKGYKIKRFTLGNSQDSNSSTYISLCAVESEFSRTPLYLRKRSISCGA